MRHIRARILGPFSPKAFLVIPVFRAIFLFSGLAMMAATGAAYAQQPAPGSGPDGVVQPERIQNPVVQFSGLDKVTGRIFAFDVSVGETVQFGALQVTPRVCMTRPPTEPPETVAFVEVDEITLQNETRRIFSGWMFADSPGLNAVEHSIYDVWITDCKGGKEPEMPDTPTLGE